jgi:hypothetical protein
MDQALDALVNGSDSNAGDIERESHRHTQELVARLVERLNRNDTAGQQGFAAAVILQALAHHKIHGDDRGAEKLIKTLEKEPSLKGALDRAYTSADPWAQEVIDEARGRPDLEPLSDDDRFPQTGHSGHGYESPELTIEG